jgi:hypothetical protein
MAEKINNSTLQEEQIGKYTFCDKPIIHWLEHRIDVYLSSNCKNKRI